MNTSSAPARAPRGAGAIVDRLLAAAAIVVALSMLVTALHDVSQAWDSGYYHLPFAARIVGILPADAFVFHPANAARFAGFPLLGELLEGILWRVGGRPEAANLLSFGSVLGFAFFLRQRFAVAPAHTVLALLAIPLVHTHAPSAYVDLPANMALSVAVLLTIRAFASSVPVDMGTLAAASIAAAVAANMKALLHPIVLLTLVVLAARALLVRAPALPAAEGRRRALLLVGALAIALPMVFATPLANLVAHGNPYYPVRMTVLGHPLLGTEDAYASSPPWLSAAPRPLRFACSLLEIGIRPLSDEHRWTVDQWMPDDSMGNRMGGFFGAYVVANVALLAWRAWSERSPEARAAGIGFVALTAVVSVMPQSHELRYYLSWMIVLVALNLWLASRAEARGPGAREVGIVAAAALAIVIASTRGAYVLPLGSTFEALVRAKVDPEAIAGLRDGERVCVRREPWNMAFAAVFHPPRRYVVVEAEEPADCGGVRPLE